MKVLLKIFAVSLLSFASTAQQEPQFTQYMDNMQYYNPAYVGSRGMLNMVGLHRQQWFGFSGAPVSSSFSLNAPLRNNLGIGFSILNDIIGPVNATWINADFSYSLRFKKNKGRLSFGVKGGVNLMSADIASLDIYDETDDELNVVYSSRLVPNAGFGVYYHSEKWFIGAASPSLLEQVGVDELGLYVNRRHYYFITGGYIKLNRMLKLRPGFMLKIVDNAPLAADFSTALIVYDKLWLGGNYRLGESLGCFAQYQLTNRFKIGYSFEYSMSKLRKYNAGSHEILLSYDLVPKDKFIATPRYF